VLNAANYGVPQNRARLFLLGCRQGLSLPKYPQPITKPGNVSKSKYIVDLPHLIPTPTVWDAIGDLPEVEKYSELLDKDWIVISTKTDAINSGYDKPSDYSSKLRCFSLWKDDYSYKRLFDVQILTSSIRTKHSESSIKRFQETAPGTTEPISHFRKLARDGICNTLRAGTARNRGAFTSPRPIHPVTGRCITVREAARLHSYPDWFRFHVTKWHGFRQVGNSVPPLLAKAVAAEIMGALGITPFKPKAKMELGEEGLLRLNMSQAAKYYGVSTNVIEQRTRKVTSVQK
ncbi:MAG: DNA cytosine methyltransferase, partial [Mastigocoleus sp. MO_167.B18]|nr:DNA cytosine methyltransferase [Mastigocoleus sp. MO_167.B18]